jgi:uncharacterized protein (DUF433 family)
MGADHQGVRRAYRLNVPTSPASVANFTGDDQKLDILASLAARYSLSGSVYVEPTKSKAMTLATKRITIDPNICNGKPVVRNLRITVESILDYLSAGESHEEILRQYPMLEPEDISACLAFASRLMSHGYSVKQSA